MSTPLPPVEFMGGTSALGSLDFSGTRLLGIWRFTLFGDPAGVSRVFCGAPLHRKPHCGKTWNRILPGIPADLRPFADTSANQFRFLPGNIVIAGLQKRACWILQPLMGKERDRVLLCELGSRLHRLPRHSCIQGCREVPPGAERQV